MSEEFSVGVKILLERMDTNPEEFTTPMENQLTLRGARWGNLISAVIARKTEKEMRGDGNFLTDAEVDALFEKYKVLRRKAFDDFVMREVLGADEEKEDKLSSSSLPYQVAVGRSGISHNNLSQMQGFADPRGIFGNAAHAQHISAHQQALGLAQGLSGIPTTAIGAGDWPYDSQPQSQGIVSKIAKSLGVK
jgi:hypothetical protein